MDTISLWKKTTTNTLTYPTLAENLEVDVAIIGGGITGITTALHLVNAGKRVAVLEAESVGGVTTGFSTGNLYVAVQPYYQNIIKKFDLDTAKQIAKSREWAINYIEKNIQEKNIKCNFSRRPWFVYTNNDEKIPFLEKEVEAFKDMGFAINFTDNLPLQLKFKKAAIMENQARFNPLQYVVSLAEYLKEKGCLIYENTRIVDIDEKDICTLITSNQNKITAKKVVMATHTPIGVNITQLFTAPYRSYVVSVHLKDNQYPEGHFWDLDYSHHATCTHAVTGEHPEILMVAGSHHKVGQDENTKSHYKELENFLRQHFPVEEVAYQWSAQHYQSADDVPYIGLASRFAKHTYMGTGFFADGLVYGTIAGAVMSDLILGKNNEWANVYNSNRFTLAASAGFLAKENANYLLQYYKDFPQKSVTNFADLKPGDGKIVEMDREKWAVYKDKKNKLHIVSAVCTHMKCLVDWNNAEKTWDCPCHGSRFTTEGEVIEGPAKINLKRREE